MVGFIFHKRDVTVFSSHTFFKKLSMLHEDLDFNFFPLNLGKYVSGLQQEEYDRCEATRLPKLCHNRRGSFCHIRWFGLIYLVCQKFYYSETYMLEIPYLGNWVNRAAKLPLDRWPWVSILDNQPSWAFKWPQLQVAIQVTTDLASWEPSKN